MLTYIRPVNCNVKIINDRKAPSKGFGIVIIKHQKNIIIPLCTSYYMTQNPQIPILQTALKHYNQFESVRTETLIWLQINTYTGEQLKVEI